MQRESCRGLFSRTTLTYNSQCPNTSQQLSLSPLLCLPSSPPSNQSSPSHTHTLLSSTSQSISMDSPGLDEALEGGFLGLFDSQDDDSVGKNHHHTIMDLDVAAGSLSGVPSLGLDDGRFGLDLEPAVGRFPGAAGRWLGADCFPSSFHTHIKDRWFVAASAWCGCIGCSIIQSCIARHLTLPVLSALVLPPFCSPAHTHRRP